MFNIGKNNSQEDNTNKRKSVETKSPTMKKPQRQATEDKPSYSTSQARNIIAKGTSIEGTIQSKGDIQIDGHLNGTIHSDGTLIVSNSGTIDGDVFCTDAEFNGEISGNVKAKGKVTVKKQAHIKGDVRYYDLQVEPGAHIACTISRLNPDKEQENSFSKSSSLSGNSSNNESKTEKTSKQSDSKSKLPIEEKLSKSKNGIS